MLRSVYRFPFAAMLVLLLTTVPVNAQDPEVLVEIEKQEVYEGESVLYRVTLNHIETPVAPQWTDSADFQLTPAGEQSLDSRQITIINGRRSEIIRRGRQYNYRLTPLRAGLITIPPPSVAINNQVLSGQPVTIRVIAPEQQNDVILEMSTDRQRVYPMQPFNVTLTIACRQLPSPFATRDPLTVQTRPPALTVPWLDDQQIPDGLQPQNSWREILEPLISRRGHGLQVNNVGSSSVFSLFSETATAFHPEPERTERTDADGVRAEYWEYQFQRTLVARRPGTYSLGPVTLKGTFARSVQQGQLVGEALYAVAPSMEVTVQEVPLQGRPSSFTGAVGTFDIHAQLIPATASVGDPMTLTLTMSGQGALDEARPPDLSRIPQLEDAFRIYEATQTTQGTSRQFTYSLRPLRADVTEFPSVAVSYFDVNTETYQTISTPPIPVTIREAETMSPSDIVSATGSAADGPLGLRTRDGGLFANDVELQSLSDQTVHPLRWVTAWMAMTLGSFALTFSVRRMRQRQQNPAARRRRQAFTTARGRIEQASASLDQHETQAACLSARTAVIGLVADHLGLEQAGLTPGDITVHLKALNIDSLLQTQTQTFLEACDAARYGAATHESAELVTKADRLVQDLHAALSRSRP